MIGPGMWLDVAGCEGGATRSGGCTLASGLDSWGHRSGVHSEHESSRRGKLSCGEFFEEVGGVRIGTPRSPLS